MEDLIKKIRFLEPTKEQQKDRTPEYAFGWVDCLNTVTELVKNYVDLHNVVGQSEQLKCIHNWTRVGHQFNGHQECTKCGKHKAF